MAKGDRRRPMRTSGNQYDAAGRLMAGYDYDNQAWVRAGVYVRCGHPETMNCGCFGRLHAGEHTQVGERVCQWCGSKDAIYIPEMMSAALCRVCAGEFAGEAGGYDYPNEREGVA